ncbi:MAG: bifunctional phosphoribosyl-AMP cyclohydrolase/phosphoribosyl-ATP diphosphatase HisIE [Acidobacteriota bacterium]
MTTTELPPTESPKDAFDPGALKYDDRGLVPVVAQDIGTGTVLMLAWANQEALRLTLETGQGWFWSRSRQELWHKGATSGNTLEVAEVIADCDADSVLYRVHPAGPACHRYTRSCFEPSTGELELGWLWKVLESRKGAAPDSSYTARLLHKGRPRIAQKVVEEAGETVISAMELAVADANGDDEARARAADELVGEAADLMYHTLVLLLDCGLEPREVAGRLLERHRPVGESP